MKVIAAASILILLSACTHTSEKITDPQTQIDCEFGILGGGLAGVYLADQIAPRFHEKICLFEKEKILGGRLTDETLAGSGIQVGTGARRVNDAQKSVLAFGKILGIRFQTPKQKKQLIHTSTRRGYSPDDFVSDFPGLIGPLDQDPNTTREDEIYALLLKEKAKASLYPTLRVYITAIAGAPAVEYLNVASRFHGDFDYDISPANYLEYLEEENQLSSINHYPVGGMSSFVKAMEARITKAGVRVYRSEPALEIEEDSGEYLVKTPHFKAKIRNLVIAVPPSGFDHIRGNIADQIRSAPEYQALLPIPIVVINQWWNESWWKKQPAWRAWSNAQCVNHTEIPQEPYAAAGKVTRSVYTEDRECVKHWLELMKNGGVDALEKEVNAGLSRLFDLPVPKPIKTSLHYWPAGWYYVRAGSKVSNQEIIQWAIEPIAGKKNLMMAGESYWPNRPGWSVGAYRSVENLLKKILPPPAK